MQQVDEHTQCTVGSDAGYRRLLHNTLVLKYRCVWMCRWSAFHLTFFSRCSEKRQHSCKQHLQISWILKAKRQLKTTRSQDFRPFSAVSCQTCQTLLILTIWFFHLNIWQVLTWLIMIKQTKHPQRVIIQRVTCSLQWACVGSTAHIRLIQGLQRGLHLHLFPAYYQPEQGGASCWTHAATVETRWGEHWAYPVTVRWLSSYAWRIIRIASFLAPDAYLSGFLMSAWHAN